MLGQLGQQQSSTPAGETNIMICYIENTCSWIIFYKTKLSTLKNSLITTMIKPYSLD